jgi:hypothetical protein
MLTTEKCSGLIQETFIFPKMYININVIIGFIVTITLTLFDSR